MSKLKLAELFETKEAELSEMIVDLYLGDQEEYLIKTLNSSPDRKNWREQGIKPRHRNIMKMIVDKSGLLFNDKCPQLDVYNTEEDDTPDVSQTALFKMLMEQCEFMEFFSNFDVLVRLLKTAMVLVQYDSEEGELKLLPLTQHNSYVKTKGNKIETLIYEVGEIGDDIYEYRVYTKDLIQDYQVNEETGEELLIQTIPNPFGIIPVAVFHDTNIPMFDFWNVIPTELVQINEIYNLHITDSEFAAAWSKQKTLFTNVSMNADQGISLETVQYPGDILPRQQPKQGGLQGGPSRVINFSSNGGETPFLEYRGPDVDLSGIDKMIQTWVADFASDWCVNVKLAGQGTNADSGFKLVVEEMSNLELRKSRAKMFEAGFNRLFDVVKGIVNVYMPGSFSDTSCLCTTFHKPQLPIDEKLNEEIWSRKITEGRATRTMYFMEVYGYSKEEAQALVAEIDAERTVSSAPRTLTITKNIGTNTANVTTIPGAPNGQTM